ncbi:MAG: DUF1491 family protein [Alphaproteobacteria bacterium]|nr:DUF1491 family protein [Alphaproteobacteria bacterium]
MEPRLRSKLWIDAEIRRCTVTGTIAVVARRGDPDAGQVLLKVNRFARGCIVYAIAHGQDGRRVWLPATGKEPVPEPDADAYIARQAGRDPDLWVLEIEDPHGRHAVPESVA